MKEKLDELFEKYWDFCQGEVFSEGCIFSSSFESLQKDILELFEQE